MSNRRVCLVSLPKLNLGGPRTREILVYVAGALVSFPLPPPRPNRLTGPLTDDRGPLAVCRGVVGFPGRRHQLEACSAYRKP